MLPLWLCQVAGGLHGDQKMVKKRTNADLDLLPLLLDPDDVAEAIGVLYQWSPGQRLRMVHRAFAEDAEYYSSWVRYAARGLSVLLLLAYLRQYCTKICMADQGYLQPDADHVREPNTSPGRGSEFRGFGEGTAAGI